MKCLVISIISMFIYILALDQLQENKIRGLKERIAALESNSAAVSAENYVTLTKAVDHNFRVIENALATHKERIEGLISDIISLEDASNGR